MVKMSKTALSLLAGFALMAAAAGQAVAETRFAVQDSTGTVDKMVVTDSGYIGVGTTTPNSPIHVKGDTLPKATLDITYSGNPSYSKFYAPTLQFTRNNLPTDNSGIPKYTDRLGFINFGAIIDGAYRQGAQMNAIADSASWSATSYPAAFTFSTAEATSLYAVERLRISSNGNIGIGVSAPAQKLEVNGGFRLNTTTAKPATCNSSTRGVIWLTQGGASVADTLEVCLKDASGNYAWTRLN
jgi:hypothetical protein